MDRDGVGRASGKIAAKESPNRDVSPQVLLHLSRCSNLDRDVEPEVELML